VAYTNLPYITDAGASCGANFNGLGPDAGITIVGGHEMGETITDQFPSTGWLDSGGAENGDKCAWISSGQGASADIHWHVPSAVVVEQCLQQRFRWLRALVSLMMPSCGSAEMPEVPGASPVFSFSGIAESLGGYWRARNVDVAQPETAQHSTRGAFVPVAADSVRCFAYPETERNIHELICRSSGAGFHTERSESERREAF
jgi:hypothetical protein